MSRNDVSFRSRRQHSGASLTSSVGSRTNRSPNSASSVDMSNFSQTCDEPDVKFKKGAYKIYVSLIYGFLLMLITVLEINYLLSEHAGSEFLPTPWHSGVLYSHVIAFYLLLEGVIIVHETEHYRHALYVKLSLVLNLLAFGMRLFYEIGLKDLRPVTHFVSE